MKKYTVDLEREKAKTMHGYLFTFIIFDFFFTYIGIQMGYITEGNPLMVWLFELPFVPSFLIRILYGLIVMFLSNFLFDLSYSYHYFFIRFALAVNIFVTFLHFRWIYLLLASLF